MPPLTDFPRSPVPGLLGPGGEKIYRFNDTALQGHIDQALKTLGNDKAFATVAFEQRKDSGAVVRFTFARKLGDHWSMAGVAEHSEEGNSAAVGVRWAN